MVSKKGEEVISKNKEAGFYRKKDNETEKILINNFISLQKVMVNLALKIDSLSNRISKLLEIFEVSAKSLAKRDLEQESKNIESKKILEKLDTISQQAGLIGKGLVLIHEMNNERRTGQFSEMPKQYFSSTQPQLRTQPLKAPSPQQEVFGRRVEGYQKSFIHEAPNFKDSTNAETKKSENDVFSKEI